MNRSSVILRMGVPQRVILAGVLVGLVWLATLSVVWL